jgi:hypothetical protein
LFKSESVIDLGGLWNSENKWNRSAMRYSNIKCTRSAMR